MTNALQSAIDAFLAPLAKACAANPMIEGRVIWAQGDHWAEPDAEAQADADPLEAEEICFYAEGLLLEGFGMIWEILDGTAKGQAPQVRLLVWQGALPPAFAPLSPAIPRPPLLARAHWTGGAA